MPPGPAGLLIDPSRADDVSLSSGYRMVPFEVESALLEHPAAVESAADRVPGSDLPKKELENGVKNVTAPYKYRRGIAFVNEPPKTTSGKIRRVDLRNH